MWLFTTLGFFSCTVSKDEPDMMQIRARERGDLEGLSAALGVPGQILETRNADYRFRLIVSPEVFVRTVTELAKRVDYSNFKDAVKHTPGQETKAVPYLRVWSAMASLQPPRPGTREPGDLFGDWADDPAPADDAEPVHESTPTGYACPKCAAELVNSRGSEPGTAWCADCQRYEFISDCLPIGGPKKRKPDVKAALKNPRKKKPPCDGKPVHGDGKAAQ